MEKNKSTIVYKECASGRYLCWYSDRDDIVSNGETKLEATDNLVELYEAVIKQEQIERLAAIINKEFKFYSTHCDPINGYV